MKNNRQQSPTRQIDYQKVMYEELERIKTMKVSNAAKIQMVTGMMYLLKQTEKLEKVKAQQNISTSFSESQSNFTMFENQIQDLEDRILHKRAIKFQINQEIQGLEEDLFEIEKTVDTKKQYDQHLRKFIQNKMKALQHVEQRHERAQQTYLNKSMKAVAGFFKGWLI